MPPISPGDSSAQIPLTPRMTLRPAQGWHGMVEVARPAAGVLGNEAGAAVTAPLNLFAPAAPPVELEIQPLPPAGVLGADADQQAILEYQPDDAAVYVLLQEVRTPEGVIYDWTLPQAIPAAGTGGVLGDTDAERHTLHFPINPVVTGGEMGTSPAGAVLGVGDLIGDVVFKRVLQVLKSPIDQALLVGVRRAEPEPRVLALRDTFQPLEGFEAWRSLLPPGGERRVLLYIHGFLSSTAGSSGATLLPQFGAGYDALLSYDHPTISYDPLQNARELLAMVPEDLRLSVDLVAHSRGGLVARSLIELADPSLAFVPRRLITHGSPHGGTRLADPERWDRLISLGMTAASWLATAAGAAVWLPTLLEYVLKAAAQSVFDLPGIAAMRPGGAFLERLNAPGDPALAERIPYAAVTSTFGVTNIQAQGFRQAFEALAMQTFMGTPNDLVVPTDSMSAIDRPGFLPAGRQLKVDVNHFSYFTNADVVEFLRKQLSSQ